MSYEIGTASGHVDLIDKLVTFVTTKLPVAERWTVNVNDTDGNGERTVLFQAPGLSGTEQIFTGIYSYKSVSSDYYNVAVGGHTGYVPGNSFSAQPGYSGAYGVPLWNQAIPYWFVGNGQRAIVFAKIESVYTSFYIGKFLPYATPTQYPYPLFIGGMLTSASGTRYDNTSYTSWFMGNRANARMRFVDGNWRSPEIFPYQSSFTLRNTNSDSNVASGYYGLHSLILSENVTGYVNTYGELDGVYFISGYNNAVENTVIIDGVTYVVLRDAYRTGFVAYIALRLQ